MKRLSLIIITLFVLLVFMSLRFFKKDSFKISAYHVTQSVKNNANLISENIVDESFLVVFLDEELPLLKNSSIKNIFIPFQDLLNENYQEKLRSSGLKIGLFSNDASKSAKAYTLLNQLGFEDLFIVQKEGFENEILLYEFHPDTLISSE